MADITKVWRAVVAAGLVSCLFLPVANAAYTPPSKPVQGGQTDTAGNALPELTVEADREAVKESVENFARHISHRVDVDESIARWIEPLCPLVAGLPQAPADFMIERISAIAQTAGAKLDDKGCKPNLYVIVTSQPVAFLQAWRRRDGNLFGQAFPLLVKRFMDSTRPISVWYNDENVGSFDQTPSTVAVNGPSQGTGIYQGFKMKGSRTQYDTLVGIRSAIVIVDTNRTKGFEIHPIADYVAMVGLMEINQDADLGRAPSVLRLFDGSDSTGLSPWDQSFLKALYQTDADSRSQLAQITASMMVDLKH
jgi:hypothetical protein